MWSFSDDCTVSSFDVKVALAISACDRTSTSQHPKFDPTPRQDTSLRSAVLSMLAEPRDNHVSVERIHLSRTLSSINYNIAQKNANGKKKIA